MTSRYNIARDIFDTPRQIILVYTNDPIAKLVRDIKNKGLVFSVIGDVVDQVNPVRRYLEDRTHVAVIRQSDAIGGTKRK